jgi:peptidoglycan LD-endopeptidase LytH
MRTAMKNLLAIILLATSISACSFTPGNIFNKKTPHEKYAEVLDDNDLDKTPEGRQWLAASKAALADAQLVSLPYRQQGYFAPDKARALGLRFTAKRGEQLTFAISKKSPFILYADLFKDNGSTSDPLLSADTAASQFSFDIDEEGSYVLRLQPELFRSGEYNLSVSVGPSLDFPVAGSKAKAGSFWGAGREGGKRRHEGIDIFAPKGTRAIASADGVVTGIKETPIGGKVVWLRLSNKNVTLYYAHLDKQLVSEGQLVKKGETVGLVGNTGNAKTTPSHLHFGIYSYAGPMDPYPFVKKEVKTAPALVNKNLKAYLRLTKAQKSSTENIAVAATTLMIPLAANAKNYILELPDGKITQLPFAAVKTVTKPDIKNGIASSATNSVKSEL